MDETCEAVPLTRAEREKLKSGKDKEQNSFQVDHERLCKSKDCHPGVHRHIAVRMLSM